MGQSIVGTLKTIFSKRNLLLSNAILCICYPVCYILLIVLPFGDEATNGYFFTTGVLVLNVTFLLIMVLNLNSVTLLYSLLAKPRQLYVRVIYQVTFLVLLGYVLLACSRLIMQPGFLTHFYHYMRFSFARMTITMTIISCVFMLGFSVLFWQYYSQIRMKYLLVFIIPAIIHFSFKTTMPFIFYIMSWAMYSGCQLLLYFSIVDQRERRVARQAVVTGIS